MIVGRNCAGKSAFRVDYVGQEYCIVKDLSTKEEHSIQIKNLMSLKKSHKEETLEKVMSSWKGQSLDYAFDTGFSTAPIEKVFDLVYSVMKED